MGRGKRMSVGLCEKQCIPYVSDKVNSKPENIPGIC